MEDNFYWKMTESGEVQYYANNSLINGTGSLMDAVKYFVDHYKISFSVARSKVKKIKQYKEPKLKGKPGRKKKNDNLSV